MVNYSPVLDLAGQIDLQPNYFHIQTRINHLVDLYITFEQLNDRLEDLVVQFDNPQPRPWQPIDWHAIDTQQVIGIDLDVFKSIIVGAIDTEAPIRGYTQTSRQYLEPIHPQLARFVGGKVDEDGSMLELGLWEKEERQHTPALSKIYQQLTGKKITPNPKIAKSYQPSDNPYEALYRHGLHRVMTEYSAVCLYLWLMAHTTGVLQQVFAELLTDEINHMTKFWGFGVWAFPQSYLSRIFRTLCRYIILRNNHLTQASHVRSTKDLVRTVRRMMGVMNWDSWYWINRMELSYTFIRVMHRLWCWNNSLTPEYLQQLFGLPPQFSKG